MPIGIPGIAWWVSEECARLTLKSQELPPCWRHPDKECPGECQYILAASACFHDFYDCGGLGCGFQPCICEKRTEA